MSSIHSNPFADEEAVKKAVYDIEMRVTEARNRILGRDVAKAGDGPVVHEDYAAEEWW